MRKHFSSLRSQMMLLTTGTVLAVVILATVFYSSAQRMSEKKAATFVHSMLVQLGDSLDRIGNEMSYLGSALHSNEVLQQYYHAPTAIQRMQYGKSFIDFTSSLLNHSTTVSHIVIVNNDQSILSPTERNIIALDTLDSKYHLFESDNLSSGFYGPAFDTFTNINFFAYVQPVYNTRQGARFRQKLGTCVIFARLDLLQSTLRSALPTPGAALMLIEQDEQIILCCDADGNTLSLLPESFCSDMAQQDDIPDGFAAALINGLAAGQPRAGGRNRGRSDAAALAGNADLRRVRHLHRCVEPAYPAQHHGAGETADCLHRK